MKTADHDVQNEKRAESAATDSTQGTAIITNDNLHNAMDRVNQENNNSKSSTLEASEAHNQSDSSKSGDMAANDQQHETMDVAENASSAVAVDDQKADDLPPGLAAMPKRMDFHHVVSTDPPEINWMMEGYLRHDTYVGQIFGEQQSGKSFLLLVICCCLACGRSYGPFKINRQWRIVLINVEDSKTQLHIRLKNIASALDFKPEEIDLIEENLMVLPWLGRFGTINGPNAADNELKRIEEIIDTFGPDLMVGDTKSRLSHGNENSNDAQAHLVRTLEQLVIQFDGPFILVHHSTKSSGNKPRGGSAWESNIRLSINLSKMDEKEAHRFGLKAEDATDRAFVMTCYDNYGAKNTSYWFKDDQTGVPREILPKFEAVQLVQEWLLDKLPDHDPVNKRALIGNRPGDDEAAAAMLKSYPDDIVVGDKKELMKAAVSKLLDEGLIFERKEGRATMLTMHPPEEAADAQPADAAEDTSSLPLEPEPQKPRKQSLRRNLGGDAGENAQAQNA